MWCGARQKPGHALAALRQQVVLVGAARAPACRRARPMAGGGSPQTRLSPRQGDDVSHVRRELNHTFSTASPKHPFCRELVPRQVTSH